MAIVVILLMAINGLNYHRLLVAILLMAIGCSFIGFISGYFIGDCWLFFL
jgi:hypothetical protein